MPQGFLVSGNVPVDWTVRDKQPAIKIVRPDGKGGIREVKAIVDNSDHVNISLPLHANADKKESPLLTAEEKEVMVQLSTTNTMSSPSIPTQSLLLEDETQTAFTSLHPKDASPTSPRKGTEGLYSSSTFSTIPEITVAPTLQPRNFFSSFRFGSFQSPISKQTIEDVTFVSQGTYV